MKNIFLVIIACLLPVWLSAQRVTLPYFENFENGMNGWSTADDGQGTAWELGTPTFGHTLAAFSGSKCWDVNLNTAYLNNANCQLISPIFDFSNVSRVYVSFQTNYRVEYLWDYLSVQYTVDNGDVWNYLPFPELNNPDGYTSRWVESSLVIDELYGYPNVQFRFSFVSDANVIYDGYSIDDFKIEMDPLSAPAINSNEDLFTVYPNPSSGEVTFDFNATNYKNTEIIIYDTKGQQVFHETSFVPSHNLQLNLSQGIYTVVVSNGSMLSQQRLVIM